MADQPLDSSFKTAQHLRSMATRAIEPEKSRLLKMARMCEGHPDLIADSLRAISDSKSLLAVIERLQP
jgi:hypothetical protein